MAPITYEIIHRLDGNRRLRHIGAKSEHLQYLRRIGMQVPVTYVCPWEAHERYVAGDAQLTTQLRAELAAKLDVTRAWAVRSSANVEDHAEHSYAGQFATFLDVSGAEALAQAVQSVWESARAPGLQAYLQRTGLATSDLKMAVIIQEMVKPVVSGVAFSRNPVTGLDEVIVEAVQGPGAALVQDGVTPQRWVNKWGRWMAEPAAAAIERSLIQTVVSQTQGIAKAFGQPVDLEWVHDGQAVYWVQLRAITGLGGITLYSNRIAREQLPGLIKPLIWSVNVPLVNSAWIRVITELIGPNDLKPEELAKAFYFRAYFNMGTFARIFAALGLPPETLELMLGLEGGDARPHFKPSRQTYRHLPRMARFVIHKLRFGGEIEAFLPVMHEMYGRLIAQPLDALDEQGLLDAIDQLFAFNQRAAYANIVGPLLMQAYNALFRKQLTNLGIAFDRFDMLRGLDSWRDYSPNVYLSALHRQFQAFSADVQERILAGGYAGLSSVAGTEAFQEAVGAFLTRFGHLSDSGNDFSRAPWREKPDFVLRMIADHREPEAAGAQISWEDLPPGARRRWLLSFLFRRARQFRVYREAIGYYYTLGYGLFRSYFLALGDRLVRRKVLASPEDIFYLEWPEVRRFAAGGGTEQLPSAAALVAARRQAMEEAADAVLPEIIYGDQAPPRETMGRIDGKLKGIPTSRGYYRGRVCVVQSVEQFGQVAAGAVIVIPYSDVSWTPLIAKAGAVVAESGGTLSHSSIVAREYNLPAIVSVTGACRLLADNMEVTVDGYRGEITMHASPVDDAPPGPWSKREDPS